MYDCIPTNNVHVYSFGLHPENHQPSGCINFSKIDNCTLNLTFSKIDNCTLNLTNNKNNKNNKNKNNKNNIIFLDQNNNTIFSNKNKIIII